MIHPLGGERLLSKLTDSGGGCRENMASYACRKENATENLTTSNEVSVKAVDTVTKNDSSMDVPHYIDSELEEVKKLFPASAIQACNTSFVQVLIMLVVWKFAQFSFRRRHDVCQLRTSVRMAAAQKVIYVAAAAWLATSSYVFDFSDPGNVPFIKRRTAYAKIQARLQFPPGYPATPLIVEVDNAALPQPFLRRLTKKAEEEARKSWATPTATVSPGSGGHSKKGQAVVALRVVMDTVENNKLLSCWKEMRQAAALVTTRGGECRADETTGLITIRVKSGQYSLISVIQVPDRYPLEGCGVQLKSHNFPERIARHHVVQAEEIVRRCLCGYSPALALQTSNPIKMPPRRGGKLAGRGNVRITSEHVRNLKHDVEFIKRAHGLREVNEGKPKGSNAKAAPPSTQEKRAARKELKTLAKKETTNEDEQARRLAEVELREQEELLHSQLSDTSQPSLLPLVDFLVNVFSWRLPQETCVKCEKKVMPESPRHPSLKDPTHKDRPTRVFCGHWFHHDCLRVWMTEPPFGEDCLRCRHRVYHPDWPQSKQQLEKSWASRQAKKREIGEVREFFTVDEQFQTNSRGDDFGAFT